MLTLQNPITLDAAALKSPNLCSRFSDADLTAIGQNCKHGYDQDELSREDWLRCNEAGMDLALQVSKEKTFPWANAANVAFPLVTIAAMQFHARAYPALVGGPRVVKCNVFGPDADGELSQRAERVSTHMSWQVLEQDGAWEEQTDKAILNLSIVGTNFKKSYFSASLGHNVSELVLAKDLVVNYWTKSLDTCPRMTHIIPRFRNEVHENVLRETWRDCLEEGWYTSPAAPATTEARRGEDSRQRVTPPQPDHTTSIVFLEQHVNLDLDADGYAEPYIVTFEKTSGFVVRIVTLFDSEKAIERLAAGPRRGQIISIKRDHYFTKATFIPSPDGGFYDIGFGVFLGPLNEAVNSLVNMLLDAGTLQTTAGGFLGRGAKVRGGVQTFAPFEWKRVDATGDDLRKSIFPLPVNAPSDVLFQLLSLLINYASRVSGTTDITVGENPGQNTPAQTTQTMVEMGQKIYTAIFKRVWRSMKEEFQKLYHLNSLFLPLDQPGPGGATRLDYMGGKELIAPAADPNVTSDSMRLQIALTLKQAAATTPGYNKDAVERLFLNALRVPDAQSIFTGTEGMPPPKDPKVALQEMKEQGATSRLQMQLQFDTQELIAKLQTEQQLNNAKMVQLQAQAAEHAANAQSEEAYAQVAMVNTQIAAAKHENERITAHVNALLEAARIQSQHIVGMKQASKKEASA